MTIITCSQAFSRTLTIRYCKKTESLEIAILVYRVLISLAIIAGILHRTMLSKHGPFTRQFKTSERTIRGGKVPEENCFNITTLENSISKEDTEKNTKYVE